MKIRNYLVGLLLLWSTGSLFAGQRFAAVVTFFKGSPVIERAGSFFPVSLGTYLIANDVLQLRDGGDVVALLMRDGRVAHLSGPRRVKIASVKGSSKWYSSFAGAYLKTHAIIYSDSTLRRMAQQKRKIQIVSPYNSSLLGSSVLFRWESVSAISKYKLLLFRESVVGKRFYPIASLKVASKHRYRSRGLLKSGQLYSWRLLGMDGERWISTRKVYFRVLKKNIENRIKHKLKVLRSMKQRYSNDIAPYVIATILLMKENLYHMALDEVYRAIVRNRRSAFLYNLRGRIYEEMNNKQLAAADYLLARKLERIKGVR